MQNKLYTQAIKTIKLYLKCYTLFSGGHNKVEYNILVHTKKFTYIKSQLDSNDKSIKFAHKYNV